MMEEFLQYISEQSLILIPVLYVIGILLKKTPQVKDWVIPWILLVCGVTLSIFLADDVLQGVIQGVLVTGASVLGHQLYKQSKDRDMSSK
ncbi:phage holin family protein [Paenibacillus yanchengensis]|uniref:Phage holin family protein n=1 Tax=Paenibacillus yanchengensis TaxID=2035833 RepID=A0ABW4YQJ8_9BACL